MNEKKDKNTLDYFKGIFHTYAIQNDPGINVFYGFYINEFATENTIEASFVEGFPEFKGMSFQLEEMSNEDFEILVDKWFYSEFSPNYIDQLPTLDIIRLMVEDLMYSLGIQKIYKIPSIKKDGKSMEREFGLVVDFVILHAASKAYFCEFSLGG